MINTGNKSTGGLKRIGVYAGIFGFIKFLEYYYANDRGSFIILITKKSPVALLGGRYIYHIDDTQIYRISNHNPKTETKLDEARYEQIFSQVDIHKNFYYSYHYDISRTLQQNLSSPRDDFNPNTMFVWNDNLTKIMYGLEPCWKIPIIHGFVDQSSIK